MNKMYIVDKKTGEITNKHIDIYYIDRDGNKYSQDRENITLDENKAKELSSKIMAYNEKMKKVEWLKNILYVEGGEIDNNLLNAIIDVLKGKYTEKQHEFVIGGLRRYFVGWKDYSTAIFCTEYSCIRYEVTECGDGPFIELMSADTWKDICKYRPPKNKE